MEHTIGSREWNLTQWTIVYRKPRANRFRRAVNWHGTWEQARAMAVRFNDRFPTLEVWYTTTKAYDDHHQHEDAHVLTANTGKRVRIMDTGEIPADMLPGSGAVWHDEDDHSTLITKPSVPDELARELAHADTGKSGWVTPDPEDTNSLAEHRMHTDTPGASCAPTCPFYAETIQAANVFGAISGDATLAGAAARLIQTGGEVTFHVDHDQLDAAVATKCATVGCRNVATHEVTWHDNATPVVEQVCNDCADSYSQRPALRVTQVTPIDDGPQDVLQSVDPSWADW